jgi:hypothetical protein
VGDVDYFSFQSEKQGAGRPHEKPPAKPAAPAAPAQPARLDHEDQNASTTIIQLVRAGWQRQVDKLWGKVSKRG